ncbi:RNA 2',3'-cyclic phosphodiesterase [Sporosarcina sp. NCCP-2716]|uniref:RNA 2',3'-cyclic phosphodiesterase n=1 Tax=Sporosarcina sp. NCCP-2716 TaxID=2943679 RepID=UPI00203B104B|nr:RNA 2',3'-cyclic phosphodiesterase [Sporosarcina sp. NCCP-2716]
MTHYFAAIPVPFQVVRSQLEDLFARYDFQGHYKAIPHHDDLHITLHFFGALTAEELKAVKQALRETAAGFAPMTLGIGGLSYFGNPAGPRVVYLSVDENRSLSELYTKSGEALADVLKKPLRQPYVPHVTIAKKTIDGRPLKIAKEQFPALHVSAGSVTLFRIEPSSSPKYIPEDVFPFGNG